MGAGGLKWEALFEMPFEEVYQRIIELEINSRERQLFCIFPSSAKKQDNDGVKVTGFRKTNETSLRICLSLNESKNHNY